jgi:hypothetical protein
LGEDAKLSLSEERQRLLIIKEGVARLDRAIRSYILFEGKGEIVEQSILDANESLTEMVALGDTMFKVVPFGLVYEEKVLHRPNKRALHWSNLFCEGIREITFEPGLRESEIRDFIDVLYLNVGNTKLDDHVTMLWRREVHHISPYVASFDLPDFEEDEAGDLILKSKGGDPFLDAFEHDAKESEGNSSENMEGDDLKQILDNVQFEWMKVLTQLRGPKPQGASTVVGHVGELKHEKSRDGRFVGLLLKGSLKQKDIGTTSHLVTPLLTGMLESFTARQEIGRMVSLVNGMAMHRHETTSQIIGSLLSGNWCRRLAPLYDETPEIFRPMINQLLEFDANALVKLLVALKSPESQNQLRSLIENAQGDLVPFFLSQLQDEELPEKEICEAVQSLAEMSGPDIVLALGNVVSASPYPSAQYIAMRALANEYHPQLNDLMLEALNNPRSAIRLLALSSLKKSGDPTLGRTVLTHTEGKEFSKRPRPEQLAFYIALADLGGEVIRKSFLNILTEKNISRRQSVVDRKLVLIDAIGRSINKEYITVFEQLDRSGWSSHKTVRHAIKDFLARER